MGSLGKKNDKARLLSRAKGKERTKTDEKSGALAGKAVTAKLAAPFVKALGVGLAGPAALLGGVAGARKAATGDGRRGEVRASGFCLPIDKYTYIYIYTAELIIMIIKIRKKVLNPSNS